MTMFENLPSDKSNIGRSLRNMTKMRFLKMIIVF